MHSSQAVRWRAQFLSGACHLLRRWRADFVRFVIAEAARARFEGITSPRASKLLAGDEVRLRWSAHGDLDLLAGRGAWRAGHRHHLPVRHLKLERAARRDALGHHRSHHRRHVYFCSLLHARLFNVLTSMKRACHHRPCARAVPRPCVAVRGALASAPHVLLQ